MRKSLALLTVFVLLAVITWQVVQQEGERVVAGDDGENVSQSTTVADRTTSARSLDDND